MREAGEFEGFCSSFVLLVVLAGWRRLSLLRTFGRILGRVAPATTFVGARGRKEGEERAEVVGEADADVGDGTLFG